MSPILREMHPPRVKDYGSEVVLLPGKDILHSEHDIATHRFGS